jgi:hypothetical protein
MVPWWDETPRHLHEFGTSHSCFIHRVLWTLGADAAVNPAANAVNDSAIVRVKKSTPVNVQLIYSR